MEKLSIREILQGKGLNRQLKIKAWVKTHQCHKNISFINVNDGSTFKNLQVVYKQPIEQINIGSAVEIYGEIKESMGTQSVELLAEEVLVISEATNFPIQKQEHSFEYLREITHIKHRTSIFTAVNYIRNSAYFAIHNFFQTQKFYWIPSPILTSNSCEGGSEAFMLENSEKFFKQKALLTVSGQFHAEALALGLGNVYTFGPTFRAEKSNSSNHLAEFWMVEPEMSFWNMQDNLNLMEKFLKYVVNRVLEECSEELEFLQNKLENNSNLLEKLKSLVQTEFEKLDYKKAIEMLKKGGYDLEFGADLNSEQEKYLINQFKKPIFIINFPAEIKAFYMKDIGEKVVSSADLLVEGIGELIGGSEREGSKEKLLKKLENQNIPIKNLEWYINLREQGYYSSAGFGLGFERLILFLTGLKNIKDAIAYPRSYENLNY